MMHGVNRLCDGRLKDVNVTRLTSGTFRVEEIKSSLQVKNDNLISQGIFILQVICLELDASFGV